MDSQPVVFCVEEHEVSAIDGQRLSALLYRPLDVQRPPVVVMAHGFGALRSFRLPAFAEGFASAGLAVMLFDYRGFGQSEGTPEEWVDPARHLQDYRSVIAYTRKLLEVDGLRLALWGSSFSGGHVLQLASEDSRIMAVVSQVPFVSGLASLHVYPLRYQLPAFLLGVADMLGSWLKFPPIRVSVVANCGLSVMPGGENYAGYKRMIPLNTKWLGRVPARIFLKLALYSPGKNAAAIQAQVLITIAREDRVTPIEPVLRMAKRVRKLCLVQLEGGHFDPYVGHGFDESLNLQREFLCQALACASN